MINLSFVLFLLVLMTVVDTVIFCIKGSYPVEVYLALVPTCITELVIFYKLKMKKSENDTSGRIETEDSGT